MLPMYVLDFERVKETLHLRVIVTIWSTTHAAAQPRRLDQPRYLNCVTSSGATSNSGVGRSTFAA
jgi:hypothetical protein